MIISLFVQRFDLHLSGQADGVVDSFDSFGVTEV